MAAAASARSELKSVCVRFAFKKIGAEVELPVLAGSRRLMKHSENVLFPSRVGTASGRTLRA
jgi:hypothetical protein